MELHLLPLCIAQAKSLVYIPQMGCHCPREDYILARQADGNMVDSVMNEGSIDVSMQGQIVYQQPLI